MQGKIHLLSDQMINLIKAGEVIENPASCIKELVENAIDAKSTSIEIEIKGGGFQIIRVIDNGEGMNRSDASTCFERHATSKLFKQEDLFAIATMGFRGEALAAIASVAKIDMTTKHENDEPLLVQCHGGKIIHSGLANRSRGTTFEIYSLFYNVPARQQFQKSARASTQEVSKMLSRIALCNPQISFRFIADEKEQFNLKKVGTLKERAIDLLGVDFIESMLPIHYEEGGVVIDGFIGKPEEAKNNRLSQYIFINSRTASAPIIHTSIQEAYATRLNPKTYPALLLHLTIPHALVDVNVHPQKKEVRLKESFNWFSVLKRGILQELDRTVSFFRPIEVPTFSFPKGFKEERFSYQPKTSDPVFFEEGPSFLEKSIDLIPLALEGGYLLVRWDQQLTLVDLRALEIRKLYQEIKEVKVERQSLLIPHQVKVDPLIVQDLLSHLNLFTNLGILLRQIGPTSFLVEELSPLIDPNRLEQLVVDILKKKDLEQEVQFNSLIPFIKYGIAHYDLLVAKELLNEYIKKGYPESALSGKPLWIKMNKEELKKLFS